MTKISAIALPLIAMVLLIILGHCEMSIYPGLRRKPLQPALQATIDESDFWAPLLEENARRRLQQQFEQQLELIHMQRNRQRQRQEQLREKYRHKQEQLLQRQQQLLLQQQQRLQQLTENENDVVDVDNVDYINNNNNKNNNNDINNNVNQYDQYDNFPLNNADFSYKYPIEAENGRLRQRIPFAVGPSDPRFFSQDDADQEDTETEEETENRSTDNVNLDSRTLDEYEEYVPAESTKQVVTIERGESERAKDLKSSETAAVLAPAPVETSKLLDTTSTNFYRIKPQNAAAAAAVAGVNVVAAMKSTVAPSSVVDASNTRHDISALISKLQKEGKSAAIINGQDSNGLANDHDHIVVRQHLGMDGDASMYLVALIAGVSAAVTVGLIALGFAWLHNKTKAAADVDYPAYGVTGPNRDISPSSGDRKLAQSAQMYHYQHQKQQIIAMENRQAVEGSCGLSDVESDDDNEEGDYTVYECPGLAPTGEMEVKNPLFLDETPVTPSSNATTGNANTNATTTVTPPTNNITQATPQQPQTIRKTTGKAAGAATTAPPTSSSSEEKKKKSKK